MLYLLTVAFGMCVPRPPATTVHTLGLGPDTPILVRTTHAHGDRLAHRLRVRGPDGELIDVRFEVHGLDVRILPREAWASGVHTVEERGDFDGGGARLLRGESPSHTAWFPLAVVESHGEHRGLRATNVRWHRFSTHLNQVSELFAEVESGPGIDWVELEVRGIGVIARNVHQWEGVFRLWSGSLEVCNDTHELQAVPGSGDLEVRIRYHGADGALGAGPWRILGASTAGSIERRQNPAPGPLSGHPADVSQLRTWELYGSPVDTTPTATARMACASLRLSDEVRAPVAENTVILRDDAFELHSVVGTDGGVRVDDTLIRGLTGENLKVQGGQLLFVVGATADGQAVVDLRRPEQRYDVLGSQSLFVEEGDGLAVLTWYPDGRRLRQRLGSRLQPLGPAEPVYQPVSLAQWGERPNLNGAALNQRYLSSHHSGADLVLLQSFEDDTRFLSLFTDRGELLWKHEAPARMGNEIWVVEEGVILETGYGETAGLWARHRDGTVWDEPPSLDPAPRREQPVAKVPWNGGELVLGSRVHFESEGGSTPEVVVPRSQMGLLGDDFVVTRVDGRNQISQTLSCSEEFWGVPARWVP